MGLLANLGYILGFGMYILGYISPCYCTTLLAQVLLKYKWESFAKRAFYREIVVFVLHVLCTTAFNVHANLHFEARLPQSISSCLPPQTCLAPCSCFCSPFSPTSNPLSSISFNPLRLSQYCLLLITSPLVYPSPLSPRPSPLTPRPLLTI